MRIVITGGAGFLGSHLADRAFREGHEIVIIDNLITGSKSNIEHLLEHPSAQFIEQDVTEYLKVDGPVDYIFHLASPASPVDFEMFPIQVLKAGSLGTHKTLGLAKAKGAKFMLASTSEVYGDPLISPQPESYWGNVNSIGPRGVYDEAKRFAEAMTMAYHRFQGVDTRIVRFFNTYGPRMRLNDGRVVPNFLKQALLGEPITVYGDGQQTRSFGFVDDIVDGAWRLAHTDFHDPVNVGTDDEHTILDFAKIVIETLNSKSEITYLPALQDDPKQRRPDLTRNRQILDGWQPQVGLREGIQRTAEALQRRL